VVKTVEILLKPFFVVFNVLCNNGRLFSRATDIGIFIEIRILDEEDLSQTLLVQYVSLLHPIFIECCLVPHSH